MAINDLLNYFNGQIKQISFIIMSLSIIVCLQLNNNVEQTTSIDFNDSNQKSLINSDCLNCYNNNHFNENEHDNERIEFIKEQILNKLGMKEVPNLFKKSDITLINDYLQNIDIESSPIKRDIDSDNNQSKIINDLIENDEHSQMVYVLPKHQHYYRLQSPIFDFSSIANKQSFWTIKFIKVHVQYEDFNDDPWYGDKLGLIIKHVSSLIVLKKYDTLNDNDFIGIIEPDQSKINHKDKMYEYDITNLLLSNQNNTINQNGQSNGEILNQQQQLMYEMIRIYNENLQIKKSYIQIEMYDTDHYKSIKRKKRHIDCSDTIKYCCRQIFYVNFTTIGWNNWIIQPSGYNANYCKGKCDLSHARYHHTTVIGKYPKINVCCSPREMSSISLIYIDIDYNVYKKNLPNMVVESCDCA